MCVAAPFPTALPDLTAGTAGRSRSDSLLTDNHQYASWNRIRGIHQQPYLARVDTNASRAATRMASQNPPPVVIDMGTPAPPAAQGTAQAAAATPGSKGNDTLFGPNIGVLGGGPEWTESQEKSSDVLTPEIVKGWIAKSKEVSDSVLSGLWERSFVGAPNVPHDYSAMRDASQSLQWSVFRFILRLTQLGAYLVVLC